MKIATWNMQGNAYNYDCSTLSEVKSRMLNENIDVFCLQEAGNFFNLISSEKWSKIYPEYDFYVARNIQIGTTSRGIPVNIYYVAFGTVNMRCSMAILVKSELDAGNPAIIYVDSNLRPVIGVLLNSNEAVYNIHAPSGNPSFAASITECFAKEILKLKDKYQIGNIVLTGDFNCPPEEMAKKGILKQNIFYYPDATHNSGSCLDYCIASVQPCMYINTNAAFSDHRQVTMIF